MFIVGVIRNTNTLYRSAEFLTNIARGTYTYH